MTRNIAIFSALVLASGWVGRLVDHYTLADPAEQGLGMLIWILAPLVTSFALRASMGDGWADLGIRLNFGPNWRWYVVSALVLPACVGLTMAFGIAAGVIQTPTHLLSPAVLLMQGTTMLLIPQLVQNTLEESGFRGYLAPKLFKAGVRPLHAHIYVGLVWGAWHLPYLNAILPFPTESMAAFVPRFLLGTVVASVVFGEIRLLTDSVWPAIIMQTTGGLVIGSVLGMNLVTIDPQWHALFAPVLEGGLMIALLALVGGAFVVRRTRAEAREGRRA